METTLVCKECGEFKATEVRMDTRCPYCFSLDVDCVDVEEEED